MLCYIPWRHSRHSCCHISRLKVCSLSYQDQGLPNSPLSYLFDTFLFINPCNTQSTRYCSHHSYCYFRWDESSLWRVNCNAWHQIFINWSVLIVIQVHPLSNNSSCNSNQYIKIQPSGMFLEVCQSAYLQCTWTVGSPKESNSEISSICSLLDNVINTAVYRYFTYWQNDDTALWIRTSTGCNGMGIRDDGLTLYTSIDRMYYLWFFRLGFIQTAYPDIGCLSTIISLEIYKYQSIFDFVLAWQNCFPARAKSFRNFFFHVKGMWRRTKTTGSGTLNCTEQIERLLQKFCPSKVTKDLPFTTHYLPFTTHYLLFQVRAAGGLLRYLETSSVSLFVNHSTESEVPVLSVELYFMWVLQAWQNPTIHSRSIAAKELQLCCKTWRWFSFQPI